MNEMYSLLLLCWPNSARDARDAARDDVAKPREVDVAVEGEAVAGDHVAVVDTHGADLVIADPHTCT